MKLNKHIRNEIITLILLMIIVEKYVCVKVVLRASRPWVKCSYLCNLSTSKINVHVIHVDCFW